MTGVIARLLDWLRRVRGNVEVLMPPTDVRLRVPQSVLYRLRDLTKPKSRVEPLALLRVRYASEGTRSVLVAVGALSFPDSAYVPGPAGANFDTDWLVSVANREITENIGVMLVHSHGGSGLPKFSSIDDSTNRDVMASLAMGVDVAPYGAVVLSETGAYAVATISGRLETVEVVRVPDRLQFFEASI